MMMKSSSVILRLAIVAISVWGGFCLTEDEESAILETLKPLALECIEDCGITEDDLKKDSHDEMDPCFKKCFLKKIGFLTKDGKYDRDTVKEQVIMYTASEDEANKIQSALDDCFKGVEDELKNDKDAEMKRIDIIYECLENFKN